MALARRKDKFVNLAISNWHQTSLKNVDEPKLSVSLKRNPQNPIPKESPPDLPKRVEPPTPNCIALPEQRGFTAINTDPHGIGWKKEEKRGKRTADTSNIGNPK